MVHYSCFKAECTFQQKSEFFSAIKLALRVLDTPFFQRLGTRVHVPNIKECNHFLQDYLDDDFAECVLRIAAITSYHPGGTCKMETQNDSVVDVNLR